MALVYLATNRVNGKQYVGFTSRTLPERRREHESDTSASVRLVRRAMNKYGTAVFVWQVMATGDKAEMLAEESRLIALLETLGPAGYNLTTGGEAPSPGPETRALQAQRTKEWFANPANRAAASKSNKRGQSKPGRREGNARSQKADWSANYAKRLAAVQLGGRRHSENVAARKAVNPEFGRKPKDVALGEQVMDLHEEGLTSRAIAARLGISHTRAQDVVNGKYGWHRELTILVMAEREEQFWLAYDAQVAAE